jgi:hypothetical protein
MTAIRVLTVLTLLGLASCADALPADTRKLLDKAEVIELLSLDPAEGKEKEGFHGYKVLGSVKLEKKADREKLLKAFYKGIDDSDGTVAACFIPRHGLRAKVDGKLIEIVICFQCLSMRVYVEGKPSSALTTGSPAAVFNEILKEHKVALPKGPGEK